MDTLNLCFAWSYVIMYIGAYCPFLMYHLRRFHAQQAHIVMTLRHSSITTIQAVIFIIKLIFDGVVGLLYWYGIYEWDTTTDKVLTAINAYLAAFWLYGFVWKFWLLHFNIHLHSAVIGSEWKSVINHKNYSHSNSFYVRYRKTLGQSKNVFYVCFTMAITFTTTYVVTRSFFSHHDFTVLYAEFDYVIPLILLIIIYCLTPSFEDNFFIRQEMKYVFICLIFQYCCYYTNYVGLALENTVSTTALEIIYFVTGHLLVATQFTAMLICTFWVNRRCEQIIASDRFTLRQPSPRASGRAVTLRTAVVITPSSEKVEAHIQDIQEAIERETSGSVEAPDQNTPNLGQSHSARSRTVSSSSMQSIMADDGLLDFFADHLVREFCIECLLSLIEMQQFKTHLKEQLKVDDDAQIVPLAPNLPRSDIVFGEEVATLETFKKAAYKLHKKYCARDRE